MRVLAEHLEGEGDAGFELAVARHPQALEASVGPADAGCASDKEEHAREVQLTPDARNRGGLSLRRHELLAAYRRPLVGGIASPGPIDRCMRIVSIQRPNL